MREPISKKLRFEVFKRDKFTCQYCGRKPPSVSLEADHYVPVSQGGPTVFMNLITSCFDCNRGKRDNLIDVPQIQVILLDEKQIDTDRFNIQRAIESYRLNRDNENRGIKHCENVFKNLNGYTFGYWENKKFRRLIKKYSLSEVLEACWESVRCYVVHNTSEEEFSLLVDISLSRVSAYLKVFNMEQDKKNHGYLFGIMRNNFYDFSDTEAWKAIKDSEELEFSIEDMLVAAICGQSISEFRGHLCREEEYCYG